MRRIALLALVCALAGCGDGEPEETFPPTNTEVVTGGFEPGDTAAIALDGGTALLTATDEGTRVELQGVGEAGAIREGSCEDPGEVVHELPDAETEIPAELVDLLAGRFVILAGDACGELISPGE